MNKKKRKRDKLNEIFNDLVKRIVNITFQIGDDFQIKIDINDSNESDHNNENNDSIESNYYTENDNSNESNENIHYNINNDNNYNESKNINDNTNNKK